MKYTISKIDLQTVVFPLIKQYNLYFLTDTRRKQFDKAIFIIINNIKKYSELPEKIPPIYSLPETPQDAPLFLFFFI